MIHKVELEVGGRTLTIETGELAKQADGAALVRYADTVILSTAVSAKQPREGVDFLPLTVDYREKAYAAGKIPGGFFKREGRPNEREILISRLTDRPIRPLFPEGYCYDTQVVCFALSADQENDPDILVVTGAAAALVLSDIPYETPLAGVRMGRINGQFVINPTYLQMEESDLQLTMAGTSEAVVMVEAGAKEVSEEVFLEALDVGHRQIRRIVEAISELTRKAGKPKRSWSSPVPNEVLRQRVEEIVAPGVRECVRIKEKLDRENRMEALLGQVVGQVLGEYPEVAEKEIKKVFEEIEYREVRSNILQNGIRADGRGLKDIRPISIRIGILPRTHGSALFQRGETQALVVSTLGTSVDEQRLDDLEGKSTKSFMLHYNFPPFSVGESTPLRGTSRREVGHGALAERAIQPVLPKSETFPYTIRIVSDILESNGSSSMATVCGASLSLMDGGIPLATSVAGIAMGLIKEGNEVRILSDILGLEDHLGDMDFKVAGTRRGITALQMDIKIGGVTQQILSQALAQAREGRIHILNIMDQVIAAPRTEISMYAPRIFTMKINADKVREVIGPGGKMIRSIIEETGCSIDVEDDG
ncbi:MAG: polyribonucleotide nucleotidyltransferase, partial [Candidatus Tectomicrobia bacterium]|nr:polyribonucleotide nucleotidyltransferase [Candidatus Tectomicrobia bacterium]